jgi:hypothetical protein
MFIQLHRVVALFCSKILDPDMSPLGFDAKKLYYFVAARFKKTSARVQEQALNWLQVRRVVLIHIPHISFTRRGHGTWVSGLNENGINGE